MGFFSKLFRKKKKALSLSEENELKEETRVISTNQGTEGTVRILDECPAPIAYDVEVANNVVSKLLLQAVSAGEIKEYSNIKKFIKEYPPIDEYILDEAEVDIPSTEAIKKLFKTWYMLSYKCTNQRLNNLMNKMK